MAAGNSLHHRREDVAGAAVGLLLGLLLHLANHTGAVVAELVLELSQQYLARLPGAQPGDLLELPDLVAPGLLELLAVAVDVALAVVQRPFALPELLAAQLERLLLCQHALLEPCQLRAPDAQLVFERVAPLRGSLGIGRGAPRRRRRR